MRPSFETLLLGICREKELQVQRHGLVEEVEGFLLAQPRAHGAPAGDGQHAQLAEGLDDGVYASAVEAAGDEGRLQLGRVFPGATAEHPHFVEAAGTLVQGSQALGGAHQRLGELEHVGLVDGPGQTAWRSRGCRELGRAWSLGSR